jgi:hypothetical protein
MRMLLLLVAVAACGSADEGKVKVAITPEHVAAVNATVPADWRVKLAFEIGTVEDQRGKPMVFRLALPKGWKPGFLAGSIQPGDADNFGRSPALGGATLSMRITANCFGACVEKDWGAEVDKGFYQDFTNGKKIGKVVKDEVTDTGRLLVFAREKDADPGMPAEVNVFRTWWKKGGSQHFICEAKLEDAATALAPVFEKACSLVSTE